MKLEIDLAPIFEDNLVVDTITVLEHLVQAWENTDADAMISALQTALYLAQVSEGDGETVRTSRRTHNLNWNATPERLSLKCLLGVLIRKSTEERVARQIQRTRPGLPTFLRRPGFG
jgi:hypothetical protein